MSVDTLGIIKKKTSAKRIAEYLKTKYTNVKLLKRDKEPVFENLYKISFQDGEDHRLMYIIQHDKSHPADSRDYWVEVDEYNTDYFNKTSFTSIDLGYWGNSIKIIKDIVKHFDGGYICECDTYDLFRKVNIND